MKKLIYYFFTLPLVLLFIDCSKTNEIIDDLITEIEVVEDSLFLSNGNGQYTIDMDGGEVNVRFYANTNWTIECQESSSILNFNKKAGTKGHETLNVTVSANSDYDSKIFLFYLKTTSKRIPIKITQKQKNGLIIADREYHSCMQKDTINVYISSNVEYNVIIPDSTRKWLRQITSNQTRGLVDSSLTFEINSINNDIYKRKGVIIIEGADLSDTIHISQTRNSLLDYYKNKLRVNGSGGIKQVAFRKGSICKLTKTNCDWIKIAGDNLISVNKNTTDNDRVAYVIVEELEDGFCDTLNIIQLKCCEVAIPQAIDLGLSVKWADFNLGASDCTQPGWYLCFGEFVEKDKYYQQYYEDNYILHNIQYQEQENTGAYGYSIYLYDTPWKLSQENDAANFWYGGNWRIPTEDEFRELFEKCKITSTSEFILLTAQNGNSIRIHKNGVKKEKGLDNRWNVHLQTSECMNLGNKVFSANLINKQRFYDDYSSPWLGINIRAVLPNDE